MRPDFWGLHLNVEAQRRRGAENCRWSFFCVSASLRPLWKKVLMLAALMGMGLALTPVVMAAPRHQTATGTSTSTQTVTATGTSTITVTLTATPTPTTTVTLTLTATATPTTTISSTVTATATGIVTGTVTPTPTITPTPSATRYPPALTCVAVANRPGRGLTIRWDVNLDAMADIAGFRIWRVQFDPAGLLFSPETQLTSLVDIDGLEEMQLVLSEGGVIQPVPEQVTYGATDRQVVDQIQYGYRLELLGAAENLFHSPRQETRRYEAQGVDELAVMCTANAPAATPTITPTSTHTWTPTVTNTPTESPTPTWTPTQTPTLTSTPTPTPVFPTQTPYPTPTTPVAPTLTPTPPVQVTDEESPTPETPESSGTPAAAIDTPTPIGGPFQSPVQPPEESTPPVEDPGQDPAPSSVEAPTPESEFESETPTPTLENVPQELAQPDRFDPALNQLAPMTQSLAAAEPPVSGEPESRSLDNLLPLSQSLVASQTQTVTEVLSQTVAPPLAPSEFFSTPSFNATSPLRLLLVIAGLGAVLMAALFLTGLVRLLSAKNRRG